jgi:hypothetical protein
MVRYDRRWRVCRPCDASPGVAGAAHPMLVTDAMPPVGGSTSTFTLYGQEISVRNGRCLRQDGTLAGAVLDMASAVRNCVQLLQVPLTHALRFASAEPASFLGLDATLGRLAPGYRAGCLRCRQHPDLRNVGRRRSYKDKAESQPGLNALKLGRHNLASLMKRDRGSGLGGLAANLSKRSSAAAPSRLAGFWLTASGEAASH